MSADEGKLPAGMLWEMLSKMPRAYRVVDYPRNMPGTDIPVGKVAIQILTQVEQMAATAEAEKYAKRLLKEKELEASRAEANIAYETIFQNEASVQVVLRAVRDANDVTRQFFPSVDIMRSKLTNGEIGALMTAYLDTQAIFGPIISRMSDLERDAWLDRIAEDATKTVPLFLLSPELRTELLIYSASRYSSLRTGTSSSGGPPDEPS